MTLPIACFDPQLVRDAVHPLLLEGASGVESLFADTVASDYEK